MAGGIAGALPDAVKALDTARQRELAQDKAEIEVLKTKKALNELRACQAILDAGGYDCTTATTN